MGSWSAGGNVNTARRGAFGLGTSSAAVLAGGYSTGFISTTEEYNGSTWSAGNNLVSTATFYGGGCGTLSAGLKAGGNADGSTTGTLLTETYDGTNWATSTNLNTQRCYLSMCGTQSAAILPGGIHSSALLTSSSWNGSTWSSGGDMPAAKCKQTTGGTQSSALTVAGASTTTTIDVNTAFSYNGSTWSTGTACNTAANQLGGGGDSGSSVIKHGGGPDATPITTTETWNGTSWTTEGNLSAARNYHSSAGNSSSGLAIAGYDGAANRNTTERYGLLVYSYNMVGGGISGGSAPTLQAMLWSGNGGGIGGGAASILQAIIFISSGGGIVGGTASYVWNGSQSYVLTMSGGGIGGSTADIIQAKLFTGSGGGVAGGSAPYSFTLPTFVIPLYWGIFTAANAPITGGAVLSSIKIMRVLDSFLYDWSDTTFKSIGWTTIADIFVEINAVNLPGYYKKEVNVATWNDGWYWIAVDYMGTPRQNSEIEILIMDGKISDYRVCLNADTTISSRLASASYTAPDNAGIDFLEKWVLNKLVESPSGTWKLYDDDGVTVLKTWTWNSGTSTRNKAV